MASFVVTTNGREAITVRSGPGTTFPSVGSVTVGSLVTSLETRNTNPNSSTSDIWQRIGTNRWVNRRIRTGTAANGNAIMVVNMVSANPSNLSLRVNVASANVRVGPGTAFAHAGNNLLRGTIHRVDRTATPPSRVTTTSGQWVRVGVRRWVWRGNFT